jgi:hypothetical protein
MYLVGQLFRETEGTQESKRFLTDRVESKAEAIRLEQTFVSHAR